MQKYQQKKEKKTKSNNHFGKKRNKLGKMASRMTEFNM